MSREGSLRRRLLLAALAFLSLALVGAGFALDGLMRSFVAEQIADRLDAQLLTLAGALDSLDPADNADAAETADDDPGSASRVRVSLNRNVDVAPYDRPLSGWYWTVATRDGQALLASRSLRATGASLDAATLLPAPHAGPSAARNEPTGAGSTASLARFDGPGDLALLVRTRVIALSGDDDEVLLLATAPATALETPAASIRRTLALALGALGLMLALAVLIQVRLGLAPLARLSDALRQVRRGDADRIPGPQPTEVQALVDEIHALLTQNANRLARAREQVANLAHGLKTPLAKLAASLDSAGTGKGAGAGATVAEPPAVTPSNMESAGIEPPATESSGPQRGHQQALVQRQMIADLDRRISHHLRRARSAALAGPTRMTSALRPHVDDLVAALHKIHASRPIRTRVLVDPTLRLACDPLDLDEMLGNLLDNAFKWAGSQVVVTVTLDRGLALIDISDDGPGLPVNAAAVLGRGERADPGTAGTGFGLPITAELAAMYGGQLELGRPEADTGLRARLVLPVAPSTYAASTDRRADPQPHSPPHSRPRPNNPASHPES